jgi:gamma-glutamyl hydrolase
MLGSRFCLIVSVCFLQALASDRPIIAILSTTNDLASNTAFAPYSSYIPAGYPKWLESGGARVVALPFDLDVASFDAIMMSVNGFLFTGGGAVFVDDDGLPNAFSLAASKIFNYVIAAAAEGESIPLWGTCQGIQLLAFLGCAFDPSVPATGFDSENLTLPLDFTAAAPTSQLWGGAPTWLLSDFGDYSKNISYNAHHNGVTLEQAARLSPPAAILSTNTDRAGRLFISSFEFTSAPITGVQFHPERTIYEWDPLLVIPHAADA